MRVTVGQGGQGRRVQGKGEEGVGYGGGRSKGWGGRGMEDEVWVGNRITDLIIGMMKTHDTWYPYQHMPLVDVLQRTNQDTAHQQSTHTRTQQHNGRVRMLH